MSKDVKNVPALRFKGYSDAWEKRKLGEVATITMGQSPDSKNYTLNPQDHILVQGNADIKNGWVEPRVWTTQITKIAKKGSVLLSVRAPVGEVSKTAFDVVLGRGVASVGQTDFLYQYLITLKINGFWLRYSTGSTFDSINSADIKDAIIFLPEKNEQSRIAKTLNCIDNLIAATQDKIDALEQAKRALLQRLFDQSWRFKGYSDPWEKRKLGETNSYFTDGNYGESYPKESELSDKENGVPFLRGSNLRNGELIEDNANYITKEKHAELTSGHLVEDDIVLAVRGSLGALGYVKEENIDWNINSQLAVIRTDKSELSGKFLAQFLLSWRGQKELLSRNTGTALKQLPIKQLKDVPVPIVNLDEQKEISALFTSIDNLIAATQSRLSSLELLKKALLQDLFI